MSPSVWLLTGPVKLEDRPKPSWGKPYLLPDIKLVFPGKIMSHLFTVVLGASKRAYRHHFQDNKKKTG